jgi:hypothetical protein
LCAESFSVQVLELVGVADLNIVVVDGSLRRAHGPAYKHTEMVAIYEDALRIFSLPGCRTKSEPLYSRLHRLTTAIADGHLEQDRLCDTSRQCFVASWKRHEIKAA